MRRIRQSLTDAWISMDISFQRGCGGLSPSRLAKRAIGPTSKMENFFRQRRTGPAGTDLRYGAVD